MNNSIISFISIGLAFIALIAYFITSNKQNITKKQDKSENVKTQHTAQTFINILDIANDIIYGMDGYKRIIINVEGINIELLNKRDITRIVNELGSEITTITTKYNMEFDICGIERPFNIEILKEQYENDILNASTDIQRTLLRESLKQLLNYGENGNVVERKFYIILQSTDNEPELIEQAEQLMECFKIAKLSCTRLKDTELKRFINLFNNMSTYNYDNMNETINSIPTIKDNLEKQKTIDEKLKEKQEMEKEKSEVKNGEEKAKSE